jgi:hypothetical protein
MSIFLTTHLRIEPPLVIRAGAVGLRDFKLAVQTDEQFGPFYDNAIEEVYVLNDLLPETCCGWLGGDPGSAGLAEQCESRSADAMNPREAAQGRPRLAPPQSV